MKIEKLSLEGLLLIEPVQHHDLRGFFCETFRADLFEAVAGPVRFVQDNHLLTKKEGTIRGLHHQRAPHGQGKLVRVLEGAILDVAVDVRPGSPTFGQHLALELTDRSPRQLYVPEGFLHGFCTLKPDTQVIYKTTGYHRPDYHVGVRWDDPDLAIDWSLSFPTLSDKDHDAPSFAQMFGKPSDPACLSGEGV